MDDGQLAEGRRKRPNGGQNVFAIGQVDAQYASLVGEDRQRLRRAEKVGKRLMQARRHAGHRGDDVAALRSVTITWRPAVTARPGRRRDRGRR